VDVKMGRKKQKGEQLERNAKSGQPAMSKEKLRQLTDVDQECFLEHLGLTGDTDEEWHP